MKSAEPTMVEEIKILTIKVHSRPGDISKK